MKRISMLGFLLGFYSCAHPQFPSSLHLDDTGKVRSSILTTEYLTPTRIVWKSDSTGKYVGDADYLLKPGTGQADLLIGEYFKITNDSLGRNGILLDFGREIQGGIEIVVPRGNRNPAGRVRVRFGESVAEAMSDIGENNSTNDHAMRDFVVTLPWLGRLQVGESGFRFVRIDLMDANATLRLKEVSAIFRYRNIPYIGSFTCNDDKLNKIWLTGAYTVHLNMQDYLWDGVKRDRLVWVGDMHPEVMTINSVFGYNDIVPKSLDFAKQEAPLPHYMNGISSYSIWWILIQRDWYYYQGDLVYLRKQQTYLASLLKQLSDKIAPDGREMLDGERFLDWPSSEDKGAIHAGLQSLMVMGFQAGAELCSMLGDKATEALCQQSIAKLKKHVPPIGGSKQAAALLALSGLITPQYANETTLSQDDVHRMSPFYGYYMLIARSMAGDFQGAMNNIRELWGGMLDLGATTFWEDFNIDWSKNAARIDELVPPGKVDVHGHYGGYAYEGFRHSLSHGWASGPTSWLTKYVLGVSIVEPGCKKIKISPHLGDLEWVKGSFPTPYGVLSIEHRKQKDGSIKTTYSKPNGVTVILQ